MDNKGQVKCGTALQSTTPYNDPSSSQQPRNQMETASGQLLYPPAEFNLRSQVKGRMANNTFHGSVNAGPGNSFLGILSGPASLLQCDFQELLNPKPVTTTSRTRLDSSGGSTAVCGIESLPPVKFSGIPSQNVSHQHLRNGTAFGPNSTLQYGLQTSVPATRHMDFTNGKNEDAASTRGQWQSINTENTAKLQDMNVQLQQKVSIEAQHSVSDYSFDFSNGCPRVFCSTISGDLLLSNTGFLGVLCSCHHFHMSVSKFCEHSGLWNGNPGDDVHMESGESIALWRKLYFQKFGIRVPEDQSGWNWPEGLSLAASLIKSSISMPTSKNSDCMLLPGSFGGAVRSRQHLDNIVLPKNSFVEGFNSRPQRNVKNGGNSQSNAIGVEDRLVVECPISRHSIVPSDVGRGQENGPHSVSAYFDAIAKNGSVSTANRDLQNLRTLINSGRSNGGKNALIVDKDTSSSIELRLGQPNHQSQPSGNLALTGIGSRLHNTLVNSQKPFCEEQMIHYVTSSAEERRFRQHLPVSGLSNPASRMSQDQSNHRQCTDSKTYHAAKQEKLKGDQVGTSLTSLFEQLNAPPGGSSYSKATNNALNAREHIISERLHCESHTAKSNPVKIHWSVGSGLEREWTPPELGCFRPVDKGKAVGYLTGNSSRVTGSGSKTQKWMENPSLLPGMPSGNSYSGFSAAHDNNHHHHHHLSSILSGAPSSGSFNNHLEKGTCFGNGLKDHTLVRSMGSKPMVSEKILTSQVLPLGVKASISSSLSDLTPVLSQQEGIGVNPSSLDDNLRSIALRQILELSKQQHAFLSLAENLEQQRRNDKLCCSLVEPSGYEEMCHDPMHPCRQYVSEIPMRPIPSGPARKMDSDKFTPVTGFNNWCNLSTVKKGIPLQHKETEMHCQLSHNALQSEQHSLRLGRSETNIESCCQGTHIGKGNCSCTTHTKCLGGKCMLIEGNPPISFIEQMGCVSDKAPALVAPDNHVALKESNVSLDQYRKLGEQLPKNASCHTYQWKDVPSKTKVVCDQVVCVKQSAATTDRREHDVGRDGDTTMKCPDIASSLAAVRTEDLFKEPEMSSISSGCSAPVVTQISIEVNNVDSSTAVAASTGYVNHLLVDEGSGIDKCWSSDDALESDRSAEFSCSACLTTMKKDASFRAINSRSSRSLLDEVKLMDSLTWKRVQNQMHTGIRAHEKSNSSQDCEMGLKTEKGKREIKLKVLDASSVAVGLVERAKHIEYDETSKCPCFPADVEIVSLAQETPLASGGHSSKPISKGVKCQSTSSLPKPRSRKREVPGEDDRRAEPINNGSSCQMAETADRKKFKGTGSSDDCAQIQTQEPTHSVNGCNSIARPIVWGNYGEISDGRMTGDVPVKYKFVSLQKVIKTARRCTLPKTCKPGQTLSKDLKRIKLSWSKTWYEKISSLKRKSDDALGYEGVNLHDPMKGKGESTCCADRRSTNEILVLEKEKGKEIEKASSVLDSQTEGEPKFKELRSRNLNELSLTGKNSSSEMVSHKKILNCASKKRAKKLDNDSDSDDSFCISGSYKISTKRYTQKHKKPATKDSFCCVCGTSSQDEINCLLECGHCLIRVHQACYGVSQVPKHTWYCRPCRTGSENIVCVLCGYGGGAMTRALRCRSIMKTFLKAWGLETDCSQKSANLSAETLEDELSLLRSSGSMVESTFFPSLHPVNVEPSTSAHCNTVMPNQFDTSQSSLACVSNVKANNSIMIGMLDTTVKQWVHMVCGLWTPETRCPNVDTMSAFDVSGVSCHRANTVCSLCNRLGGSCIQCRMVNCSIQFHPWCAHQKGLLQSEVEGVDNENVGFYGRCLLHATYPANENACVLVDVDTGFLGEEKESCARTEGYKGRKRDGFWHNLHGQSKGNGGCLVPQEQINAWIHINRQKSFVQGFSKPPMSDAEHDCRKEYTCYKQAKGWKHLVVYKSGIHALGLYTSRFISRSEMVVEYIGEIVGQRVADKREIEYQSGRKLQYKSACYFFRIDKEHIIDATQIGGIARFVNHSCQPNCVAKVIAIRNEKKVVFLAVRDIYPGEEITYDYHFNHEDEGKKIPCFCNSKNCRRYLN